MDYGATDKREKVIRRLLLAVLILWTVFIFARSLKSADDSTAESAFFLDLIRVFVPSATMHFVRKLAHFTEFFILGCLASLLFLRLFAKGKRPVLTGAAVSACYGLAAAVTDELLQLSSPGRSCQLSDMLLDLSGVLAGITALVLLSIIPKRRQRS